LGIAGNSNPGNLERKANRWGKRKKSLEGKEAKNEPALQAKNGESREAKKSRQTRVLGDSTLAGG